MGASHGGHRSPHNLVNAGLCGVVHERLGDLIPCGLRMTDILLSQCPDTAVMSIQRCAPYETCEFAPEHSFQYSPGSVPGGTVVTYACKTDATRAGMWVIALCVAFFAAALLVGVAAVGGSSALETRRAALAAFLPPLTAT